MIMSNDGLNIESDIYGHLLSAVECISHLGADEKEMYIKQGHGMHVSAFHK